VYNHYARCCGLHAPYTAQFAAEVRPEGGGGDYRPDSGGYDQLGFGTLTCTLSTDRVDPRPRQPGARAAVTAETGATARSG
jgi:hypothetical protein